MRRDGWFVGILLFGMIIGCVAPPAAGPQPRAPIAAQPTEMPVIPAPDKMQALAQAAQSELAVRLNQAEAAFELVSVEPAEWPDSAMGCPEPDKMYAQVITSGYMVRLKAGDTIHEVHVSESGQVVVCDMQEEPMGEESAEMKVPASVEPVVMAGKRDLASRIGTDVEAVRVVEFEAVDWPDSSLGCPEPGKMYLQVITPGYRVVLESKGQQFEYHTDGGKRVVYCGEGIGAVEEAKLHLLELRDVVIRVRNDLAEKKGIDLASITIVESLPLSMVEQPALCPEADQLTGSEPAFQITLQVGGETYVYRVQGETLVLCSQ